MVEIRLIPDCTFYTLFLKNSKQAYLIKITDYFKTCISPVVKKEILRMNSNVSENLRRNLIEMDSGLEYYQLIKPLVSKKEYEKGELDIIILACFCNIIIELDKKNKLIKKLKKVKEIKTETRKSKSGKTYRRKTTSKRIRR